MSGILRLADCEEVLQQRFSYTKDQVLGFEQRIVVLANRTNAIVRNTFKTYMTTIGLNLSRSSLGVPLGIILVYGGALIMTHIGLQRLCGVLLGQKWSHLLMIDLRWLEVRWPSLI